jgi:hypothetical protein
MTPRTGIAVGDEIVLGIVTTYEAGIAYLVFVGVYTPKCGRQSSTIITRVKRTERALEG